jgi:hypothetical protein
MALTKVFNRMIEGSEINIKDFGAAGDGVTDDAAAIQAAVNELGTGRIVFDGNSTYAIGSTVTIPQGVFVDAQWATIKPTSDIGCFVLRQGSQLKDVRVDVTALTYTKAAVTLSPTTNVRGGEWPQPWVDGLNVEFTGPSPTDGTALKFDATSYYIQETIIDNVVVYFGNQAVSLTAGAGEYCNGNYIKVIAHDSVYAIYEDDAGGGPVAGNVYELIAENNANNCEVQLNETATVNGALWDRAVLTFKGDYNRVFSGTGLVNDNLTDEGEFNSIQGKDVEYYYNKRSKQLYSDNRSNLRLRGWGEYADDFMTGKLGNSTMVVDSTSGSGTVVFDPQDYGGANKKWVGMRVRLTTGATSGDSMWMRWSDSGLMAGHDPVYFCTAHIQETADALHEFGFYNDSNNYILYRTDVSAGTITPRVKAGGTETVGTPISVTFNQIFWFRIVVTNTSVKFAVGNYATGSNNVGDGIYNLGNEETITTNIPTALKLMPRTYIETSTTATKTLNVLNTQINWCSGYLVP